MAQQFKRMNLYDSKASKYYKKGDIKMGRKWERKSDNIYDKNYNKIFKVSK